MTANSKPSEWVGRAMALAEDMADRACGTEAGEFVSKERNALLAHLTQHEATVAALVDALEMAVRQNEHDMVMTGDELRACCAALALARAGEGKSNG